MRKVSKGHVYQFNNVVRAHVGETELSSFFKVMVTINKLISEKKIFEEIQQDK
jgi:hypothetical protein